ncbi:M23 family metallopeptidase [Streptomyces sp. MUM 203J]|uniref:M23 family metallopeptidase n=1 Tax=Streptomyces sp. MUM 203J TaxID=2791990 RepID=UPI001F042A21|nr:M23 family metallopeptidase [Streptomyces sp. MUM 203J]MCH0542257.1 M23 family metallopeptidase [Streptomyces sp. MUM 203J]
MNDQHPHAGYTGDSTYATGSHHTGTYETGAYATGTYDAGAYGTGSYTTLDDSASHSGYYDPGHSGQYDSTAWNPAADQQWDSTAYTGQWDANAWNQAHDAQQADASQQFATTSGYDATGQWYTGGLETGAYDATAWAYAADTADAPGEAGPAHDTHEPFVPEQYDYASADMQGISETGAETPDSEMPEPEQADADLSEPDGPVAEFEGGFDGDPAAGHLEGGHPEGGSEEESYEEDPYEGEPVITAGSPPREPAARPTRRAAGSRGRRRTPAKRSALLTVAVPSACVMGVAGIAAASVSGLTGGAPKKEEPSTVAADSPTAVKPDVANKALDTQLLALDNGARDFGDRASRTQERIDLKERQEAERKKRAEEAARREAMRPKFAVPVDLHRLSARYGQSGINWMSLHTGIDFPVQYGTPVKAATDGTVRTQWNSAYGNMVIVTAADGTETWYCHLSSAKIRSGPVKAGDVIAYSGSSGNSTGPHLHFEVRPGGGAAIDPEAWLRGKGLSPTG